MNSSPTTNDGTSQYGRWPNPSSGEGAFVNGWGNGMAADSSAQQMMPASASFQHQHAVDPSISVLGPGNANDNGPDCIDYWLDALDEVNTDDRDNNVEAEQDTHHTFHTQFFANTNSNTNTNWAVTANSNQAPSNRGQYNQFASVSVSTSATSLHSSSVSPSLDSDTDDKKSASSSSTKKAGNVTANTSSTTNKTSGKKRRYDTESKRQERNAREQARCNRMNNVIGELRGVINASGVVVQKGTKACVLRGAIDLIKHLQQKQAEMERMNSEMAQRLSLIQANEAFYKIPTDEPAPAPSNGLMIGHQEPAPTSSGPMISISIQEPPSKMPRLDPAVMVAPIRDQYAAFFHSSPVPMAIASLGGYYQDCNRAFCEMTKQTRDQVMGGTVFKSMQKEDMPAAYERLTSMYSASSTAYLNDGEVKSSATGVAGNNNALPHQKLVVRGTFPNCQDTPIDLHVTLAVGHDGRSHSLCVALMERDTKAVSTEQVPNSNWDGSLKFMLPDSLTSNQPKFTIG